MSVAWMNRDAETGRMMSVPVDHRLAALLDRSSPGGCWVWTGGTFKSGYGRTFHDGKSRRVHRVMWERINGAIPGELSVLHSCDNRRCANPAHLRLGTHEDNMRDMAERGGSAGERNGRAKLTRVAVECLRATWGAGVFTRRQLAKWWGISRNQVDNIISGRQWVLE